MRGVDVRREWVETELVHSFGGNMFPGTPDGMFEDWEGALTCVQVVRVPALPDMSPEENEEIIYSTVLTKGVKSQRWMKATRILPRDFVIFGWCQNWPATGEVVGERAQQLIEIVRSQGWPFILKLMVPTEPSALFPVRFAYQRAGREGREVHGGSQRKCKTSVADLSTCDPTDFCSDDESLECNIFDDDA